MPSAKDTITLPPPRSSAVWWVWSSIAILISSAVAAAVIMGIPEVEIVHRAALVWAGLQCIGIVGIISSKKPLSGKSTISQNVRLVVGVIPGLILVAFCGWWFPGIASMLLAFAAESDRDYWVAKEKEQCDANAEATDKKTPEPESLVLQTLQNTGGDGQEIGGEAPHAVYLEPVEVIDGGQSYWLWRTGGYDPVALDYGRCGTKKDAERIIAHCLRDATRPTDREELARRFWQEFMQPAGMTLADLEKSSPEKMALMAFLVGAGLPWAEARKSERLGILYGVSQATPTSAVE